MTWLILGLTLLAVVWGWRHPRWLIPFVLIAQPLEISRTWFPHVAFLEKLGAFVGVIDLARIFALALIVYALYYWLRGKSAGSEAWDSPYLQAVAPGGLGVRLKQNPLLLWPLAYILFGLLSFIWSVDRLHTLTAVARLGILWLLGLAVYRLLKGNRDFWPVAGTLAAVATVLAALGVYQLFSKHYFWLGEVYQGLGRFNATFVDPNIYARFLILGSLATLAWLLFTESRSGQIAGYAALLLQVLALLGTGSRTGWLAFAVAFVALLVLVPRRSLLVLLGAGVLLGVFMLYKNPEVMSRIWDLKRGFWAASTERAYLLKAGWDMFVHHPLLGVGLGGFQEMMLTKYAKLIQNGVSLSHTALMTTASELGIIGLGITGVFFVFLFDYLWQARRLYKISVSQSERAGYALLTFFAVLAVTVIFLSAQGEGRFWEDPLLWVLLGYLGALNHVGGVS